MRKGARCSFPIKKKKEQHLILYLNLKFTDLKKNQSIKKKNEYAAIVYGIKKAKIVFRWTKIYNRNGS